MKQETTTTPTSAVSTRRSFLSQAAAGVAAGSAVLTLATIPPALASTAPAGALDPVFSLIEAHESAVATVVAIEAESSRLAALDPPQYDDDEVMDEPAGVEMELFLKLLEAVPTTLAGVVALVTYLEQIRQKDPWKFEDNYATPLIGALATAFSRMAVAS
jgi:hypothetical protein